MAASGHRDNGLFLRRGDDIGGTCGQSQGSRLGHGADERTFWPRCKPLSGTALLKFKLHSREPDSVRTSVREVSER